MLEAALDFFFFFWINDFWLPHKCLASKFLLKPTFINEFAMQVRCIQIFFACQLNLKVDSHARINPLWAISNLRDLERLQD